MGCEYDRVCQENIELRRQLRGLQQKEKKVCGFPVRTTIRGVQYCQLLAGHEEECSDDLYRKEQNQQA